MCERILHIYVSDFRVQKSVWGVCFHPVLPSYLRHTLSLNLDINKFSHQPCNYKGVPLYIFLSVCFLGLPGIQHRALCWILNILLLCYLKSLKQYVCVRGVRRLIYGNKCPVSDSYHLEQLVFYDYHETGRTQHSKITMQITGMSRAERG